MIFLSWWTQLHHSLASNYSCNHINLLNTEISSAHLATEKSLDLQVWWLNPNLNLISSRDTTSHHRKLLIVNFCRIQINHYNQWILSDYCLLESQSRLLLKNHIFLIASLCVKKLISSMLFPYQSILLTRTRHLLVILMVIFLLLLDLFHWNVRGCWS